MLFQSEEEAYRLFQPRPSDVIISPFAKCGTTWLQQIAHSLRTGGDMDFDDIYEVVPFIDLAPDMGIDLNGPQKAEPRLFKSHFGWDQVPKGCRYIVSFRDPQDAVVSFYYFMTGWLIEPGAIPLEEFVQYRALDREHGQDYWDHMASWLRQRDNPDVLLLTFEEMKQDLRRVVEKVANFIGVEDEKSIATAVEHSTFEFMSTPQWAILGSVDATSYGRALRDSGRQRRHQSPTGSGRPEPSGALPRNPPTVRQDLGANHRSRIRIYQLRPAQERTE